MVFEVVRLGGRGRVLEDAADGGEWRNISISRGILCPERSSHRRTVSAGASDEVTKRIYKMVSAVKDTRHKYQDTFDHSFGMDSANLRHDEQTEDSTHAQHG